MARISSGWNRRGFLRSAGALAGAAAVFRLGGVPGRMAHAAGPEMGLAFEPALMLAKRIRSREISSVELTRYFIDRIERHDEVLNAIPVRIFERALEDAARADAALARGQAMGPLHGLPMTIKESYDLEGTATTWGNPAWRDNIAGTDSDVVARYRQAGAHFLGKTNVPFMLGDYQSYNEIYGTTRNPWDPDRTPGGSSGGSAAALAAGLTGMDSGSDIGGSIRNPAHFCGVYGHKPTWGVVSSRGQAPPGVVSMPDLAVVGPMARSADDLIEAMRVVAGAGSLNAPGWRLELPGPRATTLAGLRVAVLADHDMMPVAAEVSDRVARVAEVVSARGGTVSDRAAPDFLGAEGHEVYLKLLLAIVGQRPEDNIDHQQWMALDNQRTRYRLAWQNFFRDWDVLVCPIMPTAAFPLDESDLNSRTLEVDGETHPYFQQVFWAGIATLSYLPSTVFPTGLSKAGLPIGLQVMSAEFHDATTLEFARLMAEEMGGFVPPPGYPA